MTFSQEIIQLDQIEFWVWLCVLGVIAVVSFYVGFAYFRRARLIEDTPTAKIRSAAQGFVELSGKARDAADSGLVAPLTDSACCWYRYEIEKKGDKNWHTVEKGSSEDPFIIEDETGRCIVLPKGAEVTPTDRSTWYGPSRQPDDRNPPRKPVSLSVGGMNVKVDSGIHGGFKIGFSQYRYTEERIYSGDALYALGYFESLTEADHHRARSQMTTEILRLWKQDQQAMTKRFDEDGDGKIDPQEWDKARDSASRIASEKYELKKKDRVMHTLAKSPVKGFPFIISSLPEFNLARRYRNWSIVLMMIFFTTGSGAVFLLTSRF